MSLEAAAGVDICDQTRILSKQHLAASVPVLDNPKHILIEAVLSNASPVSLNKHFHDIPMYNSIFSWWIFLVLFRGFRVFETQQLSVQNLAQLSFFTLTCAAW